MTTLENPAAEVEDPAGGISPVPDRLGAGGGLVLPEEVVAALAGQLAERARCGEPVTLTGPGGLLSGMIGQVLQAGLAAELDAHLEDGEGAGNRRNGSSVKTLNTEVGPVRLAVPRDRDGSFDPVLVPRQARRSDGLDAVVISLYAKVILSFRVSHGRDLRRPVVDSVADGTLAA
jgi:putative transposase